MRLNLGCGFDVKEGWVNTNHPEHEKVEGAIILDAREDHPEMNNRFDFILINHVLCTMKPNDVKQVLNNVYNWLKPEGIVHIIDMDLEVAIALYQHKQDDFPVKGGSLDHNFLMHVSGFGTRLSLFTKFYMYELLIKCGFRNINTITAEDEYDTRKLESLRFEATK